MNKIKSFWINLKYKFSEEYRLAHHSIYIRLCFWKLFKYWFKLRKQFISPVWKFYNHDTAEREFEYYMNYNADNFHNKLFGLHIESLGWKTKFGSIRYTHSPEIVCVINKKVRFTIRLECPNDLYVYDKTGKRLKIFDTLYWEEILNEYFHSAKGKVTWYNLDDIDIKDASNSSGYFYQNNVVLVPENKLYIIKPQTED